MLKKAGAVLFVIALAIGIIASLILLRIALVLWFLIGDPLVSWIFSILLPFAFRSLKDEKRQRSSPL